MQESKKIDVSSDSLPPPRPRLGPPRLGPPPKSGLGAWIPGISVARSYDRTWFSRDVTAGIVLTALLVPAGMGYAEACGLPAINGLYATIVPLFAYAILGPSRVLVVGPDSALTALIAALVLAKAPNDPARAVGLAAALAILSGAICLIAGLLKAGFLTDLLSKPIRVGYMNGIALTILVMQLPKLFGLKTSSSGGALDVAQRLVERASSEPFHEKILPLAIGCGSLLMILALERFAKRVPAMLLTVVLSVLVVQLVGEHARRGAIELVGSTPRASLSQQLYIPSVVRAADLADLFITSFGIALVAFADTTIVSRIYARRGNERIDSNRELVALGAANILTGLFAGFPISSSASRTPVAVAAGARTQLTAVVSALAILAVVVFIPSIFDDLPKPTLAAVVIAAALRLFETKPLVASWRARRSDFVLALIAFIAVAIFGAMMGIGIAVVVSLLDVVRRAWRPHDAILGRAPGVKGYHDLARHPDAKQIPGLVLFRWDAPLFFANAESFRTRVLDLSEHGHGNPTSAPSWIVIAAEPITDVDTTAAEMLEELERDLSARHIKLAFAELKGPVKDRLRRYGLENRIGRDFFFPTIGVATKAYRAETGVAWVDWED